MIRRLVSVAVGVFAMGALLTAAPVQAIPVCKAGFQCDRVYYTDSTHDVPVGGFTQFCDGSTSSWGSTTTFQVTSQAPCPPDILGG